MGEDFRILSETTVNFKGEKLYIMLLRESDKFGVEVVDKEKTFGRKYANNRKEAEFLFEVISTKLSSYRKIKLAEKAIIESFKLKAVDKTILFLYAYEKTLSRNLIKKMARKLKFKIRIIEGLYEGNKIEGVITINVYFNEENKVFGKFVGTLLDKDFIFELV